ncbi:MAG TPA: endonuclease NucS domain-containing protein, partial [Dehalococcoidia bacterium]|nr:endonuclease NucS domain-containing protein [Dehalococcoidia bacterium]
MAEFYRFGEEDKLESFEPSGFGLGDENLEERLEEWVEKNPHILMNGEKALVVGRQVPTDLGYSVDLLAVDRGGQAVIIELKKTKTPRQVIAQALEYAAYVANLDY